MKLPAVYVYWVFIVCGHRAFVVLWHCNLNLVHQTTVCHQDAAGSSCSCRIHYSTSKHITLFFSTRAQCSSPHHFPWSCSNSACTVLNFNVLCVTAGVQFTVCGQRNSYLPVCAHVSVHFHVQQFFLCIINPSRGAELNCVRQFPSPLNECNNFLIAGWEHGAAMRWASHKWDSRT